MAFSREPKEGRIIRTLWLKYKTEASGWPSECATQEQKDQHVKDFEAREGIKLENMEKNPGRKQVAKLTLNSQVHFVSYYLSLAI